MTLDFSGIPDHAVRKNASGVTITPENPVPWTVPIGYEDDRVYADYDTGRIDITERWDAWIKSQRLTHTVTFEWQDEE